MQATSNGSNCGVEAACCSAQCPERASRAPYECYDSSGKSGSWHGTKQGLRAKRTRDPVFCGCKEGLTHWVCPDKPVIAAHSERFCRCCKR